MVTTHTKFQWYQHTTSVAKSDQAADILQREIITVWSVSALTIASSCLALSTSNLTFNQQSHTPSSMCIHKSWPNLTGSMVHPQQKSACPNSWYHHWHISTLSIMDWLSCMYTCNIQYLLNYDYKSLESHAQPWPVQSHQLSMQSNIKWISKICKVQRLRPC